MEFSGRVTAHAHKQDSAKPDGVEWKDVPYEAGPSITQQTIFNVQWSDCPVEVEEEIWKLWRWQDELRNGSYFSWKRDDEHAVCVDFSPPAPLDVLKEHGEDEGDGDYLIELRYLFPLTDQFLQSKGVSECLIHLWW